jgi:hypothetical protein
MLRTLRMLIVAIGSSVFVLAVHGELGHTPITMVDRPADANMDMPAGPNSGMDMSAGSHLMAGRPAELP